MIYLLYSLEQAVLFKAAEAVFGDDDVVKDFYSQEFAGFGQPFVHGQVFFRRIKVAGWMVVAQDDLHGQVFDRRLENFPGVDQAGVNGADRDDLAMDLLVTGIQEEHDKMLFFAFPDVFEAVENVPGLKELGNDHFLVLEKAFAQLDSSQQFAGFGRADPGDLEKFVRSYAREFLERKSFKQFSGYEQDALSFFAGAQEYSQQFRRRKPAGSVFKQLFPGPFDPR
jgi:hypothetical protein